MPTRQYEVRVSGLVPADVLVELGDIEVSSQELRTVLSGTFPDQAALYGFLNRLRGFGLVVVEVRRVQRGDDATTNGPWRDERYDERHDERDAGAESSDV